MNDYHVGFVLTDYINTFDIRYPFLHAISAYSGQLTIVDDIH